MGATGTAKANNDSDVEGGFSDAVTPFVSSPNTTSFQKKTQNMQMMVLRSQKNTKSTRKRNAKNANAIAAAALKAS